MSKESVDAVMGLVSAYGAVVAGMWRASDVVERTDETRAEVERLSLEGASLLGAIRSVVEKGEAAQQRCGKSVVQWGFRETWPDGDEVVHEMEDRTLAEGRTRSALSSGRTAETVRREVFYGPWQSVETRAQY